MVGSAGSRGLTRAPSTAGYGRLRPRAWRRNSTMALAAARPRPRSPLRLPLPALLPFVALLAALLTHPLPVGAAPTCAGGCGPPHPEPWAPAGHCCCTGCNATSTEPGDACGSGGVSSYGCSSGCQSFCCWCVRLPKLRCTVCACCLLRLRRYRTRARAASSFISASRWPAPRFCPCMALTRKTPRPAGCQREHNTMRRPLHDGQRLPRHARHRGQQLHVLRRRSAHTQSFVACDLWAGF